MNHFSCETHVAQKSRRDKLRGNGTAQSDFHRRPSTHVQLMSGDVVVDPNMFSSHQHHLLHDLHQNPSLQSPGDLFMAAGQNRQNFSSWKRLLSSSSSHSPNSDWAVNCDNDRISDSSSNHGFLSAAVIPPPSLPFGSPQPNIPTAVPWLFDGSHEYNTNGSTGLALLPATNLCPSKNNNGTPVWLPTDITTHHDCSSSTTQNRLSLTLSSNPTQPSLPVQPHSSSDILRGAGPLGPFTGYATILKSSKYLKPAQMLLDEYCGGVIAGYFPTNSLSSLSSKSSANHDVTDDGTDNGNDIGIGACHSRLREKKAKLLLMQSEVSKSLKHYNQQIQMAISSFKSVGGLSEAMPFLKTSVKSITRHFRFLRAVISDQLLIVSKSLSEEEVRSVDHVESSEMKFLDQALLRQSTEESSALGGFIKNHGRNHNHRHDRNQPVWKPQRGLPERAVAVLRAWLFDHFLHPYPTDTDKMMLSTQTGLSRNQVSNWFINARVRVWKPMVEEIHTLDTKGLAKMDLNSSTNTDIQHNNLGEVQSDVLESAVAGAEITGNMEHWGVVPDQNKRARIGVDSGELTTVFSGYPCGDGGGGGFDMGELGLVSLTLGLRQEEVSQCDEQMSAYFGTQLVREYVG